LPLPNFANLERRNRTLAWTAWMSSASDRETHWCDAYNADIWLPAIRSISVCVSIWTGYSFLKQQTETDFSSVFVDPIRSVRLMEELNAKFSYPETTSSSNKSGILPATLLVRPSKDESVFSISRLLLPISIHDDIEVELCVESLAGNLHCDELNGGVGLSIKKATRLTNALGFVVLPPTQTSNLQTAISCIVGVSMKTSSTKKTKLPIVMMAPTYPDKTFNKSEFDFVEKLNRCNSTFELVRFTEN